MSTDTSTVDQKFVSSALASFVQIAALLLLFYWCFRIVSPFASVMAWGLILSIAVYPLHLALTARLGGRERLSALLLVLVGLVGLLVPVWITADSTIGGLRYVAAELEDGRAELPPPADSVAEWPLIGKRVHRVWSGAATNLQTTLNQFRPQLQVAGQRAVSLAGHSVSTVLQFVLSIIIAGALLKSAPSGYATTRKLAAKLVGSERGGRLTDLSILTVRSVVKGVVGVALIQAVLSAIGLLVAGVPAAGLLAGIVLVLAIVQLPPLLVLGPVAIWYFSVAETVPATIFLIFAIVVSASDTFLKPMLLGRGVSVPMLVILIGAIGGAMTRGIIGLFLGAVILALGYEILTAWMVDGESEAEEVGEAEVEPAQA